MGCGLDQVRYGWHGRALDQAVIDDLYDNENNRGLVLYNFDAYGHMYTRNVGNPVETMPAITATFLSAILGDANLNGTVDGADYTAWADYYGQSAGWGEGDFNQDGTVDGADYTGWADHYNWTILGDSAPEPASLTLLALGACLPLLRRRR